MEKELVEKELAPTNYDPKVDFLIDEAAQNYVPNSLQSFESYREQLALKIKKNFIDEFHVIRDGFTLIGKYNSDLSKSLAISPDVRNILLDPVKTTEALNKGASFQEILQWSTDDLMSIYALADQLFNQKQYYESGAIFKLLCLVQPLSYYFWMGAGDSLEADNKNQEAIATYYGGLFANPLVYELYLKLCTTLCKINEHDKAVAVLDEILNTIESSSQEEPLTQELSELKNKLNNIREIIVSQK